MTDKQLHVLIIEDSSDEAALLDELRGGGYEPLLERAADAATIRAALAGRHPVIIMKEGHVQPTQESEMALEKSASPREGRGSRRARRSAHDESAGLLRQRAVQPEVLEKDIQALNDKKSHDLRASLSNINCCCKVLIDLLGDRFDGESMSFIKSIHDETQRLNRMIADLPQISPLPHGK